LSLADSARRWTTRNWDYWDRIADGRHLDANVSAGKGRCIYTRLRANPEYRAELMRNYRARARIKRPWNWDRDILVLGSAVSASRVSHVTRLLRVSVLLSLSLFLSLPLNDKFPVDVRSPPSTRLWSRRVFRSINFGARRNDVGNATGKRRMQQKRGKMSFVISHSAVRDYRWGVPGRNWLSDRSFRSFVTSAGAYIIYSTFRVSIYPCRARCVSARDSRGRGVVRNKRRAIARCVVRARRSPSGPERSRMVPNGPRAVPEGRSSQFPRATSRDASLERR